MTEAASFDNWDSKLDCTAPEVFFEKFKLKEKIKSSSVAGWPGESVCSVISLPIITRRPKAIPQASCSTYVL